MLVTLDNVLYEIPRWYLYENERDARANSMDFSVCAYDPTVGGADPYATKLRFYYRGKKVNLKTVSGKPDYGFDAAR